MAGILLIAAATAGAWAVHAQHAHGTKHGSASGNASYAGQHLRDVSGLSPQEQENFLQGRGMGLARAAEFNGYPGPMHVMELATELELTPHQLHTLREAFAGMKAKAVALGQRYVEAEKSVDAAFKEKTNDPQLVARRVEQAAALLAEIRTAHLAAHLEIAPLLTSEQHARYARLRGYDSSEAKPH